MIKTKRRPAIDKARAFLQQKIENREWKTGDRIPGLVRLAPLADVSVVSLTKAIALLKQEGALSATKRAGTYVGTQSPILRKPVIADVVNTDTVVVIAEKIKQEILKGHYNTLEFLPSFKELKNTYKAGFRTIKRAVDNLTKKEFLVQDGRRYSIKKFKTSSLTNTIYLLATSDLFYQRVTGYELEWIETFVRTLEQECSIRNINLIKIPIEEFHTINSSMANSALGFFIWYNAWIDEKTLGDLLVKVVEYKKPLAICNMLGHPNPFLVDNVLKSVIGPVTLKHRRIYIYSQFLQEQRAGYLTGCFLFGKGHTQVCYFAKQDDHAWATERLKGLQEAYRSFDLPDAIIPLFAPITRTGISTGKSGDKKGKAFSDLEFRGTRLLSGVKAFLEKKSDPSQRDLSENLVMHVSDLHYRMELKHLFKSAFVYALNQTRATAWVCSNDYVTNYAAMDFLKTSSIKIPEQIGIISIGDQIASLFNNMSVYNFNLSGIARTMLNAILYPNMVKRKKNDELWYTISLDGMVIDRGSI